MRDIFCTWLLRCTLTVISSLFMFTTAKSQEMENYEGRWVIMTRDGYSLFELSEDSLKVFQGRGYDTSTFTLDHSALIDSVTLDEWSLTIQLGSQKEPFSITFKPLDTQTGKSLLMSGKELGDSISYCDTELLSIDQVGRLNQLRSLKEMPPADFQTIMVAVRSLRNASCKLQSSRDLEPRVRSIIKQQGYDPRFQLHELGSLLSHLKDNPLSRDLYSEIFD